MTMANWIHPLLYSGASKWSPLDMEHVEIWLDPTQIGGLADTDPIAEWPDMSGKGNHATQGVAGNRPTYRVGIQNGLAVVRFDGADDYLTCGDIETFYSNIAGRGLSVFSVAQHPIWSRKALCGKYNAGIGQRMFSFESSINYFQENAGGYNPNTNANVHDDAAWRIVSFSWEPGGLMATYINGFMDFQAAAVLNDLSDVTVPLLIGAGDPNAGTWNGDFGDQIFISDSVIGDEMTTLVAWLMAKWGIVDPYAAYIVYDTFEDANAVLLPNHIPTRDLVGGGWVTRAGAPQILNNTAVGSGLSRVSVDVGTPNQILEMRARAEGSYIRCEMRWTDGNYKVGVLLRDDINNVAVYRYRGAGAEAIGGAAFAWTTGQWYDVVITYGSDGHVIVEIDGNPICDVDEGNLVGNGTNVHFELPNVSPSWALDDLGISAAP